MVKKAQMEILGIAVVVVIILVGLMFFFIFASSGSPTSIAADVAHTQIGANTINALLKTTTPCKKLAISELITDCIDGPSVDCSGKDSCVYAKEQINGILMDTLSKWGIDFQFSVLKQSGDNFIALPDLSIQTLSCVQNDHFEQLLPTQISFGKVSLDVCR